MGTWKMDFYAFRSFRHGPKYPIGGGEALINRSPPAFRDLPCGVWQASPEMGGRRRIGGLPLGSEPMFGGYTYAA